MVSRLETSVDPELAAWIEARAAAEDRSPAAVLRQALKAYRALIGDIEKAAA